METQFPLMAQIVSNRVILANVFKFLSLRDMKSFRLVSTSWKDISAPIFRRKTAVQLKGDGDMARYLEAFATTPARRLNFINYTLNGFIFDAESADLTDTFWDKFGHFVETLQLHEVTIVGVQVVRDILFNFIPKLKDISFELCEFYETFERGTGSGTFHQEVAQLEENVTVNTNLSSFRYCGGGKDMHKLNLPIHWEHIFIAYPNLRNLEFYDINVPGTDSILSAMKSRKMKSSLQLQKFTILNGFERPPDFMDRLISLQLSLKAFSIDFGDNPNPEKVSQLLRQQMKVEELTLNKSMGDPMTGFPFQVQFNNLHYLEMDDTISYGMTFLLYMPNLSTLILCNMSDTPVGPFYNVIARTDLHFAPLPLQTKLTTLKIEYEISSLDLKKLVSWFPRVVKAELHLDNKGFRTVCGGWRNLEELEVLGAHLTTEGITGIYQLQVAGNKRVPETEYNPKNITRLTNLRQFIMVNLERHANKSTGIDDNCVDEGFLKLGRLNYLEICSKHISDDGWKKLFNCQNLLTLIPSNGKIGWIGATNFRKL